MAQLHGRVRRLPHHGLSALARACALGAGLLAGLTAAAPTSAHAQASAAARAGARAPATTTVSAAELTALAAALASEDPSAREAAQAALHGLDEDALPGIEARVAALSGHRPATADVSAAIAAVRHAAGSRRADDRLDIGPGVLPALALRRDAAMVAVCESVLLWRALEAMGTTGAYRLIADLVALDGGPWDQETHRLVERAGARLGPMLVMARSHRSASVRRWARWAGTELGFDAPGRAIQLPLLERDSALLADTLRAYGSVRQMDAMRVIASYVGSEHAQVRAAARASLALYGRNAIWVLREQLELISGEDASPQWGWERTMGALYAAHDDARLALVRADLAAGLQAAAQAGAEQHELMGQRYDAVLLRAPELAQREQMAPGYASLGADRRGGGDLPGAERAYRRALFLAPEHEHAASWRTALLAVHADMELARGVADLHAYAQVLAASPSDAHARELLERLGGGRAARARARKRLAAGGAALLLLVAALALLAGRRAARVGRPRLAEPTGEREGDPAPEAYDGGDTSPGSMPAPAS